MGRSEAPVDPNEGPVQRFALELRKLREENGKPTYRVMAARSGYSAAALSQAAGGRELPSLPVALAYARACGGAAEAWERRWRQASEEYAAQRVSEDDTDPPYRGLARFEPDDAGLFFGRERLVERLTALAGEHRFTAVFGPSGTGKSSLLRAGLIPRLRGGGGDGPVLPRPAAVRILSPGPRPWHVHQGRLAPAPEGNGDTWLIVDQFEELFTLCADPAQRTAFLDRLLTARDPASRLRVVVAVRADFLGRCAEHAGLTEALQDATLLAAPMTRGELREAIVKPASARGLIVERSLTARILTEVEGEPGALPLMSHALLETWRRRRGRALTEAMYEAAGGLHGAIARTAEEVYGGLTGAQADLARRILLRLVAPGEGTPDTRRPADRAELDLIGSPPVGLPGGRPTGSGAAAPAVTEAAAVVEGLVRARLLTLDEGTVDLAHEALITSWPRLRTWIDAERDRLRVHRGLTEAARAWEDLGLDSGALYRGSRLTAAEEAFPAADPDRHRDLTPGERAFLAASVRQRRRSVRVRRAVTAVLAVLAVIASFAAAVAFRQSAVARDERNTAIFNQVTAEADGARSSQSSLAARLDLAAYRMRPTDDLYTHLVTDANTPLSTPLTGHTAIVAAVAYARSGRVLATGSHDRTVRLWDLTSPGHPALLGGPFTAGVGEVDALVFSPDGRTLVTGGSDHTVRLWDVSDPRRPTPLGGALTGHTEDVGSAVFSEDGHTLATGSDDHTVRLWDVADPAHAHALGKPLTGHTDEVNTVDIGGPDGHTLLSSSVDGTLRLWNIADPANPVPLGKPVPVNTAGVYRATFSPDGRTVATAGNDALVRLWDVSDPARTKAIGEPLTGHGAPVWSVAFSPDGSMLASAGYDDTVRLWNVSVPAYPIALGNPLTDHTGGIWTVRFGPDGRTLATAGYDGTARLWTLPRTVLPGRDGAVSGVAFSPDGHILAEADSNGTVRLWNTADPTRPAPLGPPLQGDGWSGAVRAVAFSPDGHTLAAGGEDGGVQLWKPAGHRSPQPIGRHPLPGSAAVLSLAFSPNGHTLASGTANGTIRLWDVTRATPEHGATALGPPLTGHRDWVRSVVFSPDGNTLASGSEDDTVRLWDVADPTRPKPLGEPLTGHQGWVTSVAFSPGGHTLASAGNDRLIRLWDVTRRARPRPLGEPLAGHTSNIRSVTFSPDGRTLASGGEDDTVRLWDVADPAHAHALGKPLTGHTDAVTSVSFRNDGGTLASAGWDVTVRLWQLHPDRATASVCAVSDGNLTPAQWQQYVPQLPYDPQC